MDIGSSMFDELKKVLDTIEIKYDRKASVDEDLESRTKADYYKMAREKTDVFSHFKSFEPRIIKESGITSNEILIQKYAQEPNLIPTEFQNRVMEVYRKITINEYVDGNNYYRRLSGQPDKGDINFFYVDYDSAVVFGVDPNTPIHLLQSYDILVLENNGYIEKLKKENPDKKYLNFLGINSVDPLFARDTRNFGILRLNNSIDSVLYETFVRSYNKARDYFATVIYNKSFSDKYKYYDEFIAMNILVMSIHQLVGSTYKNVVEREFFDLTSIKAFFDCFEIPYLEHLPLERQRLLVKNINKLLHYKSTNRVLYELCSILGYEQLELFQYYLVKEHRMDENGIPIFATKLDSLGNEVPNYELMYDIYFQSVNISDPNPSLSFIDKENKVDYNTIIINDPYWWDEDDELKKKLYETEFNYAETKYLSLNTMYRLTKMMFEVCHFFRIVQTRKKYTGNIMMGLPKLFSNEQFSVFDIIVFTCALVSKRNGMAGDIMDNTTKVMSVVGFNFNKEFPIIKDMINKSKYLSKDLLSYFMGNELNTVSDINRMYAKVRDLHDVLKEKLANTKNIDEYHAYKKFYKAVLVSDDTKDMYTKKDGQIATTFLDYLLSESPVLGDYVNTVEGEAISLAINHVVFRLQALLHELKYIGVISEDNDVVLKSLIELIKFFKSYTTDLTSFNVVYLMDDRGGQIIKVVDKIGSILSDRSTNDKSFKALASDFALINAAVTQQEEIHLRHDYVVDTKYHFDFDKTPVVTDLLHSIVSVLNLSMRAFNNTFQDVVFIQSNLRNDENIKLDPSIIDMKTNLSHEEYVIKDQQHLLTTLLYRLDKIPLSDIMEFVASLKYDATLDLKHKMEMITTMKYYESLSSKEQFVFISMIKNMDKIPFNGMMEFDVSISEKEDVLFKDREELTTILNYAQSLTPKERFDFVAMIDGSDVISISDMISFDTHYNEDEKITLREKESIDIWFHYFESLTRKSQFNIISNMENIESISISDLLNFEASYNESDKFTIKDKSELEVILNHLDSMIDKSDLTMITDMNKIESIGISDTLGFESSYGMTDKFTINDKSELEVLLSKFDKLPEKTKLELITSFDKYEDVTVSDILNYDSSFSLDDKFVLEHDVEMMSNLRYYQGSPLVKGIKTIIDSKIYNKTDLIIDDNVDYESVFHEKDEITIYDGHDITSRITIYEEKPKYGERILIESLTSIDENILSNSEVAINSLDQVKDGNLKLRDSLLIFVL